MNCGKVAPRGQEQKGNICLREDALISIVIPTLNAAETLPATLACLRSRLVAEIIVADGGSSDGTVEMAMRLRARVLHAKRGRGSQIAAGAGAARAPWLLILHADTQLSPGWERAVRAHIRLGPGRAGFFRLALHSADWRARVLERLVAWRCRLLALPYGDQGLLIERDLLAKVGGIKDVPLMEDVDLVRRLGRARLAPLAAVALTDAGKWERQGWLRRSMRNLLCLSLWFAGTPPRILARLYE